MLQEKELKPLPGGLMLGLLLIVPILLVLVIIWSVAAENGYTVIAAAVLLS